MVMLRRLFSRARKTERVLPGSYPVKIGRYWWFSDGTYVPAMGGGEGEGDNPPPASQPKVVPEAEFLNLKGQLEAVKAELATIRSSNDELTRAVESERAAKRAVEEEYAAKKPDLEKLDQLKRDLAATQTTLKIYQERADEAKARLIMSSYGVPESVVRTEDGKGWLSSDSLDMIERTLKLSKGTSPTRRFDTGGGGGPYTPAPTSGLAKIREGFKEASGR
jgi:hypothetical protein